MEIESAMVIEMMGRPKDYLKDALSKFLVVLEAEPEIKVTSKKIHEPKEIKGENMQKELFSAFAEVEIKCDLTKLFYLISKYMPSHVEIIKPEGIKMSNLELASLLTEFATRLHKYDEIAKGALMKNQFLEAQIKRMQQALHPLGMPHPMPVPQIQQVQEKSNKPKKKAKKKK